jgi:cytochrome c oxidase subunit I+III
LLGSGVLLSVAVLLNNRLVARLRKGDDQRLQAHLWVVTALGAAHSSVLLWVFLIAPLDPVAMAHDAVLKFMLYYLLIHSGVSVIFTGMQAMRVRCGYVNRRLPYEPVVLRPFWIYTLAIYWCSFAAFILMPMAWGPA